MSEDKRNPEDELREASEDLERNDPEQSDSASGIGEDHSGTSDNAGEAGSDPAGDEAAETSGSETSADADPTKSVQVDRAKGPKRAQDRSAGGAVKRERARALGGAGAAAGSVYAADRTRMGAKAWKYSLPWMALSLVLIAALLYVSLKTPFGDRRAVAKVGGSVITREQLYTEMAKVGGDSTLQQLIMAKVIDQQAKKAKVTVTDADIQNEINNIKKTFPSQDAFNQALAQQGITMADLKKQLVTQVKVEKILAPKIKITDADMQNYFKQNHAQFDKPAQTKLSHILLNSQSDADAVLKDLNGGADFAAEAKAKSQDTATASNGGDMGYLASSDMDPAVAAAVAKMAPGQVSGVIHSSSGYEIVKVTDQKASVPAKYADVKDQIHYQMMSDQVNQQFQTWYPQVEAATKIENYLSPNSTDPMAGLTGGTGAVPGDTGAVPGDTTGSAGTGASGSAGTGASGSGSTSGTAGSGG